MTERRWLDDGASPEVQRLLESAVIDEPSPEQLASLRARVEPMLQTPSVGSAPVASGLAGKVIGGIALVTLGVGAGVFFARREEAPPVPPVVVVAPPPVREEPAAPPPPVPVPVEVAAPRPKPAPVKRVEAPPPPPSADEELELLQSAMSASSATESLALVGRHVTRFPESSLSQEREVLAVKALMQLARVDEAKERAAAFKRRWPTSPHLLRVESLVAK